MTSSDSVAERAKRAYLQDLRRRVYAAHPEFPDLGDELFLGTITESVTESGYTVCNLVWRRSTIADKNVFHAQLREAMPEGTLMFGSQISFDRTGGFDYMATVAIPYRLLSWAGYSEGFTILRPDDGWIDAPVTRATGDVGEQLWSWKKFHDFLVRDEGERPVRFGQSFDLDTLAQRRVEGREFADARSLFEQLKPGRMMDVRKELAELAAAER